MRLGVWALGLLLLAQPVLADSAAGPLGLGWQFGSIPFFDLPNTGRLWSIIETQEPTTVAEPLDTGGLETGSVPLFGALGASWTENYTTFNGIDIGDPYSGGLLMFDPGLDVLSSVEFVSAAKPAALSRSGANVVLTGGQPDTKFHGAARLFYSGSGLQSDNINSTLTAFHFPGPEKVQHLVDGSVSITSSLGANLPSFFSGGVQDLSKTVGGFAPSLDGREYHFLAALRPVSRTDTVLDVVYLGQHLFSSPLDPATQQLPSTFQRGARNSHLVQARYRRVLDPSSRLGIDAGFVHNGLSMPLSSSAAPAVMMSLPQSALDANPPFDLSGSRSRFQAVAAYDSVLRDHLLRAGLDYQRSSIDNRWNVVQPFQGLIIGGVPSLAVAWSGGSTSTVLHDLALYLQDDWRPAPWLVLPLGLRFGLERGSSAGPAIQWTALQPRAGIKLIAGGRKPTLTGSWTRYMHAMQGQYFDYGNAAAPGAEVFGWQDLNHDLVAEPSEAPALLTRSGGPFSAIDPAIKPPLTDEFTVGAEQPLGAGFRIGIRLFRRDERNIAGLVNTGVPFSAYSPVTVADPGNDGIPGTHDDQQLTLFNRDPAFLGQDFLLLTNPQQRSGMTKGFQIEIHKSFSDNWEVDVSFSAAKSSITMNPGNTVFQSDPGIAGNLGADPNTFQLAKETTFFDRGFSGRMIVYYLAPRDFRIGVVGRYYDGLAFGRELLVQGFNQGPFFVMAAPRDSYPQGFRTLFNLTLDARISRRFEFRTPFTVCLDVFNLLNSHNNTKESDQTGPDFEKRVPLAIQAPRIVRLGFQWEF